MHLLISLIERSSYIELWIYYVVKGGKYFIIFSRSIALEALIYI